MYDTSQSICNALLVAVETDGYDEVSLLELEELVKTAGANPIGRVAQNRSAPDLATCVGKGKLEEIKAVCGMEDVRLVVFDNELSPTQLRNIESFLEVKVTDRSGIILDIFALRATSAEGKVQVELAQLNYLLPRLRGEGVKLSRLAGGIGTRGPGESQLETDRRHILRRIHTLKQQLEEIRNNREMQRQKRKKNQIPVVALAGYTNAGKSTLMNRLCDAGVFVEDMLFATLDSTTRKLRLPNGREILLSDTVGFIRNLPHELIYAFQSTLEEIKQADLVLLVCDITGKDFSGQLQTVQNTLDELGYRGKILQVLNKFDLCVGTEPFPAKDSVYVSAATGFGISELLEKIQLEIAGDREYSLNLPYRDIAVYYRLKELDRITSESFEGDRIEFTAYLSSQESMKYRSYIVS